MKSTGLFLGLLLSLAAIQAQPTKRDIPYATGTDERQKLDIYAPEGAKNLPVIFWIHGGGWQYGNRTDVQNKPKAFVEKGFVFVSTGYRLLPNVEMLAIFQDVAKSLAWVHKNIAAHGGDPNRIIVGGHSAGAQLAALVCIDDRYLKAEGLSFSFIKGCFPVDGDTYDLPAIIEVAEVRARAHGYPLPTNGHRQKFGNDPVKHVDYSAITHVAKNKGIPPFLIMHAAEHPDTSAQAQRLARFLRQAEIPTKVYSGRDTTHDRINNNIGLPDDPGSKAVFEFAAEVLK